MDKIKLDKNYNIIIEPKNPYTGRADELIEDILRAQEKKEISKKDAALLLSITLRNEVKNDIYTWFKMFQLLPLKEHSETSTLFMHINKEFKNA